LIVVKLDTFIKWHRTALKLFSAMEVPESRPPASAKEHSWAGAADVRSESDLGRGSDRKRTFAQAWHPYRASNSREISGYLSAAWNDEQPAMVHIRPQQRESRRRL
jgi:hypothetical protein